MSEVIEKEPKSYVKYIIYCFGAFAWMCATLTMPLTLPLSQQFGSNPHILQLSITILLFCFAISQFVGGALSDVIGRKKIVLSFLSLNFIGLLISALSVNIYMFIVGQTIAGLGSGVLAVTTRAIAADYYKGKVLGKIYTTNAMLIFISPILSSLLGMLFYSSVVVTNVYFIFLIISGLLIAISALFLPETLLKEQRAKASIKAAFGGYFHVLRNASFVCYWITFGTSISLVIGGILTVAPHVYMQKFGISSSYYTLFVLMLSAGIICGIQTTRARISKITNPAKEVLVLAIIAELIAVALFIICKITGLIDIYTVSISFLFACYASGLLAPIANNRAMVALKDYRGSGAALMSVGATVCSTIVSLIIAHTLSVPVLIMMVLTLVGGIIFSYLRFGKTHLL